MSGYIAKLDHKIQGIPCLIGVLTCQHDTGNHDEQENWDIEYDILDMKSHPAGWLRTKMTDNDELEVEEEIISHFYL